MRLNGHFLIKFFSQITIESFSLQESSLAVQGKPKTCLSSLSAIISLGKNEYEKTTFLISVSHWYSGIIFSFISHESPLQFMFKSTPVNVFLV